MTGIVLTVGADHPNCVVKLKVYTNAGKWTEFTATVPETAGGAATQAADVQLQRTPTSTAPAAASISATSAPMELTFEGVTAVDGMVSLVGVIGLTTKTADFTAYEKINLGDRVWNDANNNGTARQRRARDQRREAEPLQRRRRQQPVHARRRYVRRDDEHQRHGPSTSSPTCCRGSTSCRSMPRTSTPGKPWKG